MKNFTKTILTLSISILLVSGVTFLYAQSNGTTTGETTSEDVNLAEADVVEPSDVVNLEATAGDSEVQLTWDAATDDVGVTGYKIYRGTRSVKNPEDMYDLPVIPVGNVKGYTVKNLTNDQIYYFSVTAMDAAGNESLGYAKEVSSTPKSGLRLSAVEDDGKSPQVKEVTAEDVVTVKVVFSEPVKLPEDFPQSAFVIEKTSDKSKLPVQAAQIDSRDESGATVLLTTPPQVDGEQYILTVGIEVKDYFNTPVISGTSDTGSFKGSAKQKTGGVPTDANVPPNQNLGGNQGNGNIQDLIAPEDVTKFIASIKNGNAVELKWSASKDSKGDLANQLLYQSNDRYGKAFGPATPLGTSTTALEVQDLNAGNWYTFKITTKDTSGNESKGIMKSLFLSETGPGLLAAGLTALVAGIYSRRKKRIK